MLRLNRGVKQGTSKTMSFIPVAVMSAEGERKISSYLLKVLQRDVAIHVQIIILHDRLQRETCFYFSSEHLAQRVIRK